MKLVSTMIVLFAGALASAPAPAGVVVSTGFHGSHSGYHRYHGGHIGYYGGYHGGYHGYHGGGVRFGFGVYLGPPFWGPSPWYYPPSYYYPPAYYSPPPVVYTDPVTGNTYSIGTGGADYFTASSLATSLLGKDLFVTLDVSLADFCLGVGPWANIPRWQNGTLVPINH